MGRPWVGWHSLRLPPRRRRRRRRPSGPPPPVNRWVALLGYAATLGIAVGVIPQIYAPAKW